MCIGIQRREDISSFSLGGLFAFERFFVLWRYLLTTTVTFVYFECTYERKFTGWEHPNRFRLILGKQNDVRQLHASSVLPACNLNQLFIRCVEQLVKWPWIFSAIPMRCMPGSVLNTLAPENIQTNASFSTKFRRDVQYHREQTLCQSVCKSKVFKCSLRKRRMNV